MPAARVPAYYLDRHNRIVLDPTLREMNPGSDEAIENGCRCPVIDNRYGRGVWDSPENVYVFWYSSDCPIHGDVQ